MAGITHITELKEKPLKALAREVDRDALEVQYDILNYSPDEKGYDFEFVYDVVKNTSQMAAMIGFGADHPVRDRAEVARRMGEIAKYGWKDIITENELPKLNTSRHAQE